jgi:hypothetical protein
MVVVRSASQEPSKSLGTAIIYDLGLCTTYACCHHEVLLRQLSFHMTAMSAPKAASQHTPVLLAFAILVDELVEEGRATKGSV